MLLCECIIYDKTSAFIYIGIYCINIQHWSAGGYQWVKLRVVHAPRMAKTFPPSPRVSDPDEHHDTCVTHMPLFMGGSLTSGFLWSRWRGKRCRHSRRMSNPQFYVSGKRPMATCLLWCTISSPFSPRMACNSGSEQSINLGLWSSLERAGYI